MNKNELITIIRTIVKEEVEKSLPLVLSEILSSKAEGTTTIVEKKVQPKLRQQKQYSTNPIFNQILNETQGGVPGDPDSQIASAEMPVPGAQVSILDKVRSIPQSQLNENKEVAGVLNVLRRDFRQVVRAIDKKAANVPTPNFKMGPGAFDQE